MIWVWLQQALLWVGRMLIPPAAPLRKIRVSEYCPACGHTDGKIAFSRMDDKSVHGKPMVQHACSVCHFSWYEDPVSIPAIPAV